MPPYLSVTSEHDFHREHICAPIGALRLDKIFLCGCLSPRRNCDDLITPKRI